MATSLWFRGTEISTAFPQSGVQRAKLDTTTVGWDPAALLDSRRASGVAQSATTATVAGPTNGVECSQSAAVEWHSEPLDQDVTIAGTITFNLWASESGMNANVAINCLIERLGPDMTVISTIVQTARVTEVSLTTSAVNNFTATPTSTSMKKGDRFRVRVFGDDAGTMGTGFTFDFVFAGSTAAANGDSFVTFTETFGFLTTDPAGSVLYLTDTAGPAVGANIEKEMWTSRGAGVTSIVRNTAAGWTAPLQWTDSGGGTPVEWYSKRLTAFTLSGRATVRLRLAESSLSANAAIRAQLAICNDDGTNVTIWADCGGYNNQQATWNSGTGEIGTTTEDTFTLVLAGNDLAVAGGQRLRLIVSLDDGSYTPIATGFTATLWYAGTTPAASGDSYVTLVQTVTEFTGAAAEDPMPYVGGGYFPT